MSTKKYQSGRNSAKIYLGDIDMSEQKKPSNRIAELRKTKGLTLQQVADAIGVGNNTISRYENGKREPSQNTMIKLSKYFDVPVNYLMGMGWSRYDVLKQIVNFYFDTRIDDPRFYGEVNKYGVDYENLSNLDEDELKKLNINTTNQDDNKPIYVRNVIDNLLSKSAKQKLDDEFHSLTYKLHAYHLENHEEEFKQIAKSIFSKDLECLNDYAFLSKIGEDYEKNYISPQYEIAERLQRDLEAKNAKNRQEYLNREPYKAVKEIISNIDLTNSNNTKADLLSIFNYFIDRNEELHEEIEELEGKIYDLENPNDFDKYSNGDY